jgi:glutamyl-tRNA synthetase
VSLRGRYAPSPSGALHLGNASTALLAWLSIRSRGGALVMRVEDLDRARTRPEAVRGNLDELRWLGLDWDEGPDVGGAFGPYLQSEREGRYREALDRLESSGAVFECYLTRRDLRDLASAPHGGGPVYGERERRANASVRADKIALGKAPSLRLRSATGSVAFDDLVVGRQVVDADTDLGDIVLRRADGAWAYQLAVVVDDIAMGITEVLRGDDLLASTHAQLQLYAALGAHPPRFAHVPLLLGADGRRMAKRNGSLTLASLRSAGVTPDRVVGWLAWLLRLAASPEPLHPSQLLADFELAVLKRDPVLVTEAALAKLGVAAEQADRSGER